MTEVKIVVALWVVTSTRHKECPEVLVILYTVYAHIRMFVVYMYDLNTLLYVNYTSVFF